MRERSLPESVLQTNNHGPKHACDGWLLGLRDNIGVPKGIPRPSQAALPNRRADSQRRLENDRECHP